MADSISEDIVKEILLRVDPKSIGKCMAVCKSWNFLIKSNRFLSSYQPRTPLFLVQPSDYEFSLCSPQNIEYSNQPLSEFAMDKCYTFVGAVNGLICLSSYRTPCHPSWSFYLYLILFNPLTRRSLRLPISKTLGSSYKNRSYCLLDGFGFDSKKNDFKVVHIGCCNVPPKVELYSLNEGAWRDINNNNTPFDQDLFINKSWRQQLFFHDSVHWLACGTIVHDLKNHHIVIFNVVEEKFSKTDLPQVLAESPAELDITVIDGCLSVVEYPQQPRDNTNIWMKREESWSKIYTFSLSRGDIIIKLLGQNTSSEVLVLSRVDSSYRKIKSLHSYDLKSQEMRDLGVNTSRTMSLRASDFTYSLFMLDKESNADVSVWVSSEEENNQTPENHHQRKDNHHRTKENHHMMGCVWYQVLKKFVTKSICPCCA